MSERTTAEVAVRNRMSLPEFRAGKDGPSIFSAGTMNIFSRTLRALTNPRIVWGEKDDAQITDGNFLITLSRASAMGDGGTANVIHAVVIDDSPDDYLICKSFSGGVIGDYIYVAKPIALRRSMSDHILLPVPVEMVSNSFGLEDPAVNLYAAGTITESTRWLIHHFYTATIRRAYDVTASISAGRNELDDDYIITGGSTDIKTLSIKYGLKTFEDVRTSLNVPLSEFQVIIPRYLTRSEENPVYGTEYIFPGDVIAAVSGQPMIPNDPREDDDAESATEPLWKPILADALKADGTPDIDPETELQKKVQVNYIDLNLHARAWARAIT